MNKVAFILGIVCLALIVLYWRQCHSSPLPPPTKSDSTVNEIVKKAASDTLTYKKFADSVVGVNKVIVRKNDSLVGILNLSKGLLKGKDKDIQGLIANINKAEAANNQTAALAACDSLKAAYPIAKGLVTQYINTNDSLRKSTVLLLANKDTLLNRISGLYQQTNNQLFEVSRLFGNVSSDYKKALISNKKRFGLGPFVGVGIADGKIVPTFGVGLTLSLFKF